MTAGDMRELALAMPGAEEKSHFGQPDFRVKNKIFAGLSADGARGTLKLTPEIQEMVVGAKPDAFVPAAGAWGRSGWTYVVLARADKNEVATLVREAWTLTAPKKLVAAESGGARQASAKRKRR